MEIAVLIASLLGGLGGLIFLILHLIASFRVSKHGGSGIGNFFLSWIYILFSQKANHWKNFSKVIAVVLGIITCGLIMDIYIIIKLK
jgi:Na+-transporting NADH:ubiquinone oxidoreductase subunit NqrB